MQLIHLKFKAAHIDSGARSQPPFIERRGAVALER
jgi:hypothetical protein